MQSFKESREAIIFGPSAIEDTGINGIIFELLQEYFLKQMLWQKLK